MDGRGTGGCIARYSGGVGAGEISYGMTKVERIMLKFRPIAPKPMAAGSGSSGSTVEHSDGAGSSYRRRKRRYVKVNGNNNKNTVSKKRKVSASSDEYSGGGDAVVTLSLMPETPDRKENSPAMSSPSENQDLVSQAVIRNRPSTILLSFNKGCDGHVIASPSPRNSVVTSLVTVECVMETWINNGNGSTGLGLTDQARVMSMEMDTCPSFITNCRDTVVWTNKAYREMTSGGGGTEEEAVVVVVKKFNRVVMPVSHMAFTCKVKVTWGTERGASPLSVTAPCDVWRLRYGGYAWRLDVNAALCLGR